MEGNFETTNEVIVNWIETKLKDICRCIGLFTNYLLIPRDGFIKHLHPVLPLPVVKYVVEEIFNCSIVSSKNEPVSFPDTFSVKVRRYLKEYIVSEVIIGTEVVEYLWKYISLGVANLTEGINVNKEIEAKKSRKKKEAIQRRKEAMAEFKKKMADGDEKEIEEYSSKKIREYKELRNKIKDAIKSSQDYIIKYESDTNFRTYSAILNITPDDEDLLRELTVEPKRIKRMRAYKELENEQNKSMDEKSIDISEYTTSMIELLNLHIATLERILREINNSRIAVLLKSISEEAWEKEYFGIEKKKHINEFMKQLDKSLKESFTEIEDDTTLRTVVEKRAINRIKTKIASFQSYISQKTCDSNSFDRDIDGCIIQSLIYLMVTLTDWLEVDYITSTDILYTLRILLPSELSSHIPSSSDESDDKFKLALVKGLQKYNLKIKGVDYNKLDIITATINSINKLDPRSEEYEKFNNRVRYFANTI